MRGTPVALACALLFVACKAESYPSTYPFDKDAIGFPNLPDATPNESKIGTNEDPGGYMNRLLLKCDPNDYDIPNFQECRWMVSIHFKGSGKVGTEKPPNCTEAKAPLFESSMLTGELGGHTICDKGKCCTGFNGIQVERIGAVNGLQGIWNDQAKAANCPAMNEPAYCSQCATTLWKCTSYIPTKNSNKRSHTRPCLDNEFLWLKSCPLFKASPALLMSYNQNFNFEPKHYLEKLTAVQQMVFFPAMFAPDRVCQPYTYYFPESPNTPPGSAPSPAKYISVVSGFALAVSAMM